MVVTCAFANASLDINVAFNEAGEVVGFTVTPVGSIEQQFTAKYEAPAYVNQDLFKEQDVQIGQGEWVLPGTLSLPLGNEQFTAVVLVHGSGPQDRDETIGPNKPFRDLAWGLASQGIAVLRYDKRTKVYADKMREIVASITVKEEVIDDALGARNDVQFKSYPGLTHLFMPVEGGRKAIPADYNVPGHVVEEVMNDISFWIKHAR
jgi:hypothetical protein